MVLLAGAGRQTMQGAVEVRPAAVRSGPASGDRRSRRCRARVGLCFFQVGGGVLSLLCILADSDVVQW